jgi:hypothetical protein
MKTKLLSLLFILILVACEKRNDYIPDPNQKIFFQLEYVNYAWGFQHSGWMIDNTGAVRGFNLPKAWTYIDSQGFISSIDMDKNIEQLDTAFTNIDNESLTKYVAKIYDASKGKITDPKSQMADAGGAVFSAFIYDSKLGMYKQVMLKQTGDVFIDNESIEANDIYSWMTNIRRNN